MNPQNPNNLTQEQIKQGYSTIPGAYDPLTGKLKTSNVITPDSLAPQPKLTLPTTPVSTTPTAPATNLATDTVAQLQAKEQEQKLLETQNIDKTETQKLFESIVGNQLTNTQSLAGEAKAKAEATQVAQPILQDIQNIDSQIKQKQAELVQIENNAFVGFLQEEKRDTLLPFAQMGQSKILADKEILKARKYSEIAILNAQVQAKTGQAQLAIDTANAAVEAKYAPFKEQNAIYEAQLKAIEPLLTREEKKQATTQKIKLDLAMREIEKAEAEEKTSNSYLFTAIQGKAPQSLIAKAQDLINKGAKPNEVAKVLGQYSMSLGDRLDIQLKQRQIDKINTELSTKNPDAGELVKINGKDYIRYKDGTISDPVLPEAGDTGVVVSRLDNKLKTLDKLTKGSVGLSYSAGALRTPLGKPLGFINQINDWRADAVNVIQKLTVDELGRVKSDGVTFGALSNGERQAVGDAATALGAASKRDKEGNPTGEFKMSEKKVLEEFQKIKDGYALDFERRTGVPYEQYIQNPEIVQQKSVDDFIDSAGTALINNNTYGGYPTN